MFLSEVLTLYMTFRRTASLKHPQELTESDVVVREVPLSSRYHFLPVALQSESECHERSAFQDWIKLCGNFVVASQAYVLMMLSDKIRHSCTKINWNWSSWRVRLRTADRG